MSWFNWPPDPDPMGNGAYFRDRKLLAQRIDPGVLLAILIHNDWEER